MTEARGETAAAEVLEALMGGWQPGRAERARRVTRAARLLAWDLVGAGSASVCAADVGDDGSDGLARQLEDVALHLAERARPLDAFGSHRGCSGRGWRTTDARGAEPCAPDAESARALRRLVDAAARSAAGAAEALAWRLWSSRCERWAGDRGAAELSLDGLELDLRAADLADAQRRSLRAELLEERLALLLDRGGVSGARELVEERPDHVGPLAALMAWGFGDDAVASASIGDADPGRWAERVRAASPGLPVPVPCVGGAPSAPPDLARATVGARAMVLFAREETGARAIWMETAPGLSAAAASWRSGRRAFSRGEGGLLGEVKPGGPGAALVRCAERPRDGRSIDAQCMGGAGSAARAVLCLPLGSARSAAGGPDGWLWVEFDHRLLPSAGRVASLVFAGQAALARRSVARPSAAPRSARFVEQAIGKLARRAWALVPPGDGPGRAAVRSGGAHAVGALRAAPSWPARRAARDRVAVRYGAPIRSRAWRGADDLGVDRLFEASRAGAALPLCLGDVSVGAIVVESTRRDDGRPPQVERWERGVERAAHGVFAAELEERLLGAGGFGVDAAAPDGRALLQWIARVASRSGAAVVEVAGPAGSGRRTVARALHAARAWFGFSGPITHLSARGETRALTRSLERASCAGGTVVLGGADALLARDSAQLEGVLSATRRGGALLVLTTDGPRDGTGRPGIDRFDLSAISRRRHWVAPIIRSFVRSRSQGGEEEPVVSEEVLAGLWRQEWRRGARDLVGLLRASPAPGESTVAGLRARAEELGLGWRDRIPPADATERDLASALWSSRTAGGRLNKRRAARFLGWDPATLAGRIRALGIEDVEGARSRLD